jgi:hypothetical protein
MRPKGKIHGALWLSECPAAGEGCLTIWGTADRYSTVSVHYANSGTSRPSPVAETASVRMGDSRRAGGAAFSPSLKRFDPPGTAGGHLAQPRAGWSAGRRTARAYAGATTVYNGIREGCIAVGVSSPYWSMARAR